tara:strand:+ start:450 stop:779 length:330 start_codon:yes stop_codon:yes gene_type:complete
MKIKVRMEDVDLIIFEGTWDTTKQTTRVGVLPDDFDDSDNYELLFEHEVDQKVYYWFTEFEFKKAIDMLTNTHKLYPLDDGAFIYEMTNDNKPFEITLEESEDDEVNES